MAGVRNAGTATARVLEILRNSDILCEWLEGDHDLIGNAITGCIFPGATARAYVGSPRRVEANITVYVLLYHGVIQPKGLNQSEALALEEQVIDLLEKDTNLGNDDLVINTLVTRVEHGEVQRTRSKYYATRITLMITSRFNIGMDYD